MKVTYRAVRSRRKFIKAPEVKKKLAAGMDAEVKPHLIDEFKKRVANWKHKPDFKARKHIETDRIYVYVYPAGEHKNLWIWTDKGTPAHKIRAKNAPSLSFMLGFWPKTNVGGQYGHPGGSSPPAVFAQEVDHPGTAPRRFTENIAKEQKKWYSRTMENLWRRVIRSL